MSPLSLSGPPASEPTPEGQQMLVPGVVPITTRDRLAALMGVPLTPNKPQKPIDHGLFNLAARDQFELFSRSPS